MVSRWDYPGLWIEPFEWAMAMLTRCGWCGRIACDLVEKIASRAVVAASALVRASAIVVNVAFLAARAPALAIVLRLVRGR